MANLQRATIQLWILCLAICTMNKDAPVCIALTYTIHSALTQFVLNSFVHIDWDLSLSSVRSISFSFFSIFQLKFRKGILCSTVRMVPPISCNFRCTHLCVYVSSVSISFILNTLAWNQATINKTIKQSQATLTTPMHTPLVWLNTHLQLHAAAAGIWH